MSRVYDEVSRPSTAVRTIARIALVLCAGTVLGLVAAQVSTMETRWQVMTVAGILGAAVLLFMPNRESFLWGLLVLALQFDLSVRLFYGQAGSTGLNFPMPFLVCAILVPSMIMSGRIGGSRPIRWGHGAVGWLIAALVGVSICSAAFSSEHFISLTTLVTQVELYLIYFATINFVRTEEQMLRTIRIVFWILLLQSIVYFIESALKVNFSLMGDVTSAGELPRPGGTVASGPSGYTSFILPALLLATSQFLAPGNVRQRGALPLLAFALGIVALGLTLTRAAWGAFALGTAVMVVLALRGRQISTKRLGTLLGMGVAVGVAILPIMMARLESEPTSSSYSERMWLMKMAARVIEANPLLGVGPGAYGATYKLYLTPELADKWQWIVHNHYLLRAAEIGIPGGIVWVLLLLAALRQAFAVSRSPIGSARTVALGWAGGIVALSFTMYWDMWTLFTTQSMFWFMLGLMGAASALTPAPQSGQTTQGMRRAGMSGTRSGATARVS